jgi:hypothetical protein
MESLTPLTPASLARMAHFAPKVEAPPRLVPT